MRWSEVETYKFVKLYLGLEYLWNANHPGYKSKEKRIEAYNTLIANFRSATGILLSEAELKVKIKNLRSTYTQELTKIINRSGPDCSYKPTIKWFAEWHKCFKNTTRKRIEGLQGEVEYQDPSENIWVLEDIDNHNEEIDSGPFVSQPETRTDFSLKLEPIENQMKTENPENTYKMKRKKIKRRSPSSDQSVKTFRGSMDSSSELAVNEDEFDIYGKYIASQLRQMDMQRALRLQLEIQSLVSEARISELTSTL